MGGVELPTITLTVTPQPSVAGRDVPARVAAPCDLRAGDRVAAVMRIEAFAPAETAQPATAGDAWTTGR